MGFPTHYIKKRDTLHSEKSTPAALSQIGRDFFAAERFSDALDFFEKAKDLESIRKVKDLAVSIGDTFLLSRLDRYDRTLISKAEWEAAAQKAEASGRGSMADFVKRKFAPLPGAAAAAALPAELPGEAPLSEV
jgi:hypothetical protein